VTVLVLTVPFATALRGTAPAQIGLAVLWSLVLAAGLLRWAWGRARGLSGQARPDGV
jgi:hypothetical protein